MIETLELASKEEGKTELLMMMLKCNCKKLPAYIRRLNVAAVDGVTVAFDDVAIVVAAVAAVTTAVTAVTVVTDVAAVDAIVAVAAAFVWQLVK